MTALVLTVRVKTVRVQTVYPPYISILQLVSETRFNSVDGGVAYSPTGPREGSNPSAECLRMVEQGVVCTCRSSTEDRDSPPSNTGAIIKHTGAVS